MTFQLSSDLVGSLIGIAQATFPTNYLVRWICTDRGLKWGVPIAVVLVPIYFQLLTIFQTRIEAGGSDGWNLALIWALIDCIKFVSVGIRTPFVWLYGFARCRILAFEARRRAAVLAQW